MPRKPSLAPVRLQRRRLIGALAALPLWALPAAPVFAQVGRAYHVELVIFEHTGPEGRQLQTEIAREHEPNLTGSRIGEGAYQVSEEGFDLGEVTDRLEESGAGRVIARLAWEQIGRDHRSAPWLRIREGQRLGPRDLLLRESVLRPTPLPQAGDRRELEGRLRIWVGHFLHLETDLVYHVDPDVDPSGSETSRGVVVRGHQRMNSGDELFYLDHPVVGIIARVTRLDEEDDEEPGQDGTGPEPGAA
ncbi:MAG: CsiV family protein [Pseudomonadota bacterium]